MLLYLSIQATCIGNNWNAAVSMLKQEYKEGETSLKEALDLSIKVCNIHLSVFSINLYIKVYIYLSVDLQGIYIYLSIHQSLQDETSETIVQHFCSLFPYIYISFFDKS